MAKNKDPEIRALKTILDLLSDLEPPTRDRIIKYVVDWLDDQLANPTDQGFVPAPTDIRLRGFSRDLATGGDCGTPRP